MSKYLIAHHLGMGDMIVLNGLVRHIYDRESKAGNEVHLLCYEHNHRNVARMYDDIDMKYVLIKTNDEIGAAMRSFDGKVEDLHLWSEPKARYADVGDEAFFINFGYNLSLLTSFGIRRDMEREKEVLYKLTSGNKKFIFVHDDAERGFPIDESKLPAGYKAVRADKSIPMFDLLLTMERAKECHVISSSFLCIGIARAMKNIVAHLYLRNDYLKNYLDKYGIKTLV
jgi:hypothetical protein